MSVRDLMGIGTLEETNSLVNSTANCGLLFDTTFSSKPCSLYTLSLNNLANPSAVVPSIVATKCIIFDSLS